MDRLTDHELFEAYLKAIEINCSAEFIQLLKEEIKKRRLAVAA